MPCGWKRTLTYIVWVCVCVCVCVCVWVAQSCLTLCNPMDNSPQGSFVHSPGKNTGVGCHALLQGMSLNQGPNPGLLHYRWILHHLSYQGSSSIFLRLPEEIHMGKSNPIIQMEMEVQENEANRNQDLSLGLSTLCLLLFTNFISWQQSSESENWRKSS